MSRTFPRSLLFLLSSLLASTGLLLVATRGQATLITVTSTADTVIRADQAGDNFGAYNLAWVGADGKGTPRTHRELLEFNLSTLGIPAGATINSVSVQLTATGSHGVSSDFGLYRTLVDWGEGVKTGKGGAAATAGEASWTNRLTGTAAWAAAGGKSGTDYAATASATKTISSTGTFTWSSTAALVADVNYWLANPTSNFGWFLISSKETTSQSVTKFATREDTNAANRPVLTIDYTAPAAPSLFSVTSGPSPAVLRIMHNTTATSAIGVTNTGGSAGTLNATSTGSNAMTINLASQSVNAAAVGGITATWADNTNTGARSGQVTLHNATNLSDTDKNVSITGAVVDDRIISAPQVDFGRFAAGSTALATTTATLATSGDSNHFTNVTVNAPAVAANADGVGVNAAGASQLFNVATATMARTVTLNKVVAAAGQVSGNLALPVAGENLTGEADAASIPYTYRVVNKRTVTGPGSTVDLGKILKGATVTAPVVFGSTTGDDNSFTRVSIANQASGGLTLGGTPVLFDGSVGTNSRTVSFTASTAGAVNGTANFAVTPENIGDTGYATINVAYTGVVGTATPKITPAGTSGAVATFDPTQKLTATVTTSYAGLSSTATAGGGALGSTATLLGGVATPGQVSMNWRTRAADETWGSGSFNPALFKDGAIGGISDVVNIEHPAGTSFVLEMKYDPAQIVGGNEAGQAANNAIYVSWFDGSQWVSAGTGTNLGAWTGDTTVGHWGVNTVAHTAWVVTNPNQNSQYMVVPEPSTMALLVSVLAGLAGCGLATRRLRSFGSSLPQ